MNMKRRSEVPIEDMTVTTIAFPPELHERRDQVERRFVCLVAFGIPAEHFTELFFRVRVTALVDQIPAVIKQCSGGVGLLLWQCGDRCRDLGKGRAHRDHKAD